MTFADLMYVAAGPTPICMAAAFIIIGVAYLIARRNEAFYSDHKYPQDDVEYTQARAFKAKCAIALWGSEAFLATLLAATIFYVPTVIAVTTVAVLSTALAVYRHWPNLQSES